MQLMWVSGPTGTVKTISVTARKVVIAVSAAAFVLVLLGVLLHFIGFRIAVEVSPGLARSLGGVTTEAEQQKVEAVYRERLDKLRETMNTTVQEIRQLEALKNRFMDIATPTNLRDKFGKKDEARGGPKTSVLPVVMAFATTPSRVNWPCTKAWILWPMLAHLSCRRLQERSCAPVGMPLLAMWWKFATLKALSLDMPT